jgi:glycosyltransferase involved in cell wall biosynthesis
MRSMSDLKICFLAGTLDRGGAEQQLFYMLKALRAIGANVHLLSLQNGGFWDGAIGKLGVPNTYVGGGSRLNRFMRINTEVRKLQPDLLQSQHFYTNAYAGAIGALLRIPAIGAMRSNGESEVRACGRILGPLCLRLPRILAANSRAALNYALGRGIAPDKLQFLPNVVDSDCFRPAEREPRNEIKLLCIGRLVPEKRFDRFLRVLAEVRRTAKQPVRGVIVTSNSPGNGLAALRNQARELGLLSDGVEFVEASANIASVYHEADICVLTSDFEGTPNVLLEAMACGLPVVATRVGGVPEIVTHGETGFLADRDDEQGICSALLALIESPALRREMGDRARRYIETNHSFERLTSALVGLYNVALQRREPAERCVLEEGCA